MKRIIALLVLSSLPALAWNPFRGKTGYVLSVIALGAAHAADYRTTRQGVTSGVATELNPLLQPVVNHRDEFIAVKIGAGVVPVALELWHQHKHPQYMPLHTISNWGIAGSIGSVAWHNHQIYVEAGSPPPIGPAK